MPTYERSGPEEDASQEPNRLKQRRQNQAVNPDDGENWPEIDVPCRLVHFHSPHLPRSLSHLLDQHA